VRKERKMRGFTLVELLIVLLILGILIGLAVPRYLASIEKSKETTFCSNVRNVISSIEAWRMDTATTVYPDLGTLNDDIIKSATYFSQAPVNPYTGTVMTVVATTDVGTATKGVFGYGTTEGDLNYEIKTFPDCGIH